MTRIPSFKIGSLWSRSCWALHFKPRQSEIGLTATKTPSSRSTAKSVYCRSGRCGSGRLMASGNFCVGECGKRATTLGEPQLDGHCPYYVTGRSLSGKRTR
jgi:hypothetical protein